MKNRIITALLVCMLVVGLLLMFINPIQSLLIQRSSTKQLDVTVEQIKENEQQEASFDFEAVQSLTIEDVLSAQFNVGNVPVIGSITIPSVDMELPIIKGVGEEALTVGAGTMKPEQVLGEGNYALASHYIENKDDILFGPLYNTQLDDLIYVTNKEETFTYKITSIKVIEATDVHVIADANDKTLLTLITCAEDGVKRLAVVAEFVERKPFTTDQT